MKFRNPLETGDKKSLKRKVKTPPPKKKKKKKKKRKKGTGTSFLRWPAEAPKKRAGVEQMKFGRVRWANAYSTNTRTVEL
jgi:hypothetical protein